jgi:hypothetical protein
MNPDVSCVIPDVLRLYLESKTVCCIFPVFFGVASLVATTSYIAADETNPEIICAVADAT